MNDVCEKCWTYFAMKLLLRAGLLITQRDGPDGIEVQSLGPHLSSVL